MNFASAHGVSGDKSWLPVVLAPSQAAATVRPQKIRRLICLDDWHPLERLDAWRQAISGTFTDLVPDPVEGAIDGLIEMSECADIHFAHIAGSSQTVRHVSPSKTSGYLFLNIPLAGWGDVRHAGGHCRLSPGWAVLVDPGEPFQLIHPESFRQLCVMLPDWIVRGRLETELGRVAWRPISLTSGVGGVLASAIGAALEGGTRTECANRAALFVEVLVHLLRSDDADDGDASCPSIRGTAQSKAFGRIRDHIARHFSDEALSVASTAVALKCSGRSIHHICSGQGTTFGQMLIANRLEAAARMLLTDARSGKRVSEVAYGAGFSDISHFSKVFKKRYGKTPSAYRDGS